MSRLDASRLLLEELGSSLWLCLHRRVYLDAFRQRTQSVITSAESMLREEEHRRQHWNTMVAHLNEP